MYEWLKPVLRASSRCVNPFKILVLTKISVLAVILISEHAPAFSFCSHADIIPSDFTYATINVYLSFNKFVLADVIAAGYYESVHLCLLLNDKC